MVRDRARAIARGMVGLGLLGVIVEILSRTEIVSPTAVPPASAMLLAAARLLVDPSFLAHVGATLAACAGGLAVATSLAVPLGLALGSSARAYRASVAAIELLRPIPSVALIPLAILLLGRGLDMKVLLVAYASSWPLLLNTVYGVHAVDPVAHETARAFGLRPAAIRWRVTLPGASPAVLAGLRIAAPIALIVSISAELIGGGRLGIGVWMLANAQAGVPRDLLFGGIVITGLVGLGLSGALVAAERSVVGWHHRGGLSS